MDRAFGKKFSISQARMHAHNVVRILTAGGPAEMNRQCRQAISETTRFIGSPTQARYVFTEDFGIWQFHRLFLWIDTSDHVCTLSLPCQAIMAVFRGTCMLKLNACMTQLTGKGTITVVTKLPAASPSIAAHVIIFRGTNFRSVPQPETGQTRMVGT